MQHYHTTKDYILQTCNIQFEYNQENISLVVHVFGLNLNDTNSYFANQTQDATVYASTIFAAFQTVDFTQI